MNRLTSDEKATAATIYSRSKLIRGQFITNKDVRVSIWPRGHDRLSHFSAGLGTA